MHLLRGKPSPAMVVAVCALAFAMVGTAVAGTDGLNEKLTKSKVKKIAKKQADKRLKANVTGSHVNLADSATNADNATNATNAANATDATTATQRVDESPVARTSDATGDGRADAGPMNHGAALRSQPRQPPAAVTASGTCAFDAAATAIASLRSG